jgi:hypothetical protein
LPAVFPEDSEEAIAFTGSSRSVGCMGAGPVYLYELFNEGVTRKPHEANQRMSGRSDDPNIKMLSLCEQKQDAQDEMQSSVYENEETNSIIECFGRNTFENMPETIISEVNGSHSTNDKQILSDDTAVSLNQQNTELSSKHSCEPSIGLPAFFREDSEEPIAFTDRRSVGVIRKPREANQQMPGRNDDPNIKMLSLCEQKQNAQDEMQSSVYENEETNSIIELFGRNTFEYVPEKIISEVSGSHSTNDKQILSDDTAESLNQQHTELSFKHSCEPSIGSPAVFPEDSEEPIAFTGSGSMGCLGSGPVNLDELFNVGVTRKPREANQQMPGRSDDPNVEMLSPCEQKQDTHEHQHATNKTDHVNANIMSVKARQRSIETESDPFASPSTYKRDVVPNARNEIEYRKTNAVSMKARQASVETASDPFGPPSTYKRGVIPKYLKERREAMQKDEKKCKPNFPGVACPAGHVTTHDSYRNETLKMLKKRYSDLAQELRMMPITTDIRMIYTKKTELTKKLKEVENAIQVFFKSDP